MGELTGPGTEAMVVPSVPASIARVRRFAVGVCRDSGFSEQCDVVALLVSEVATNALVHGTGDVQVRVTAHDEVVRVEVADESPRRPQPRRAGLLEEGGRGLALVDSLASAWGVEPAGTGKIVWFELP